jgi:hypothetical protein
MMLRFALMLCYAMERFKYGKGSISMTSFTLALLPFDLSLFKVKKMKKNVSELKLKVPIMTPLSFSSALAPMTFDLSL